MKKLYRPFYLLSIALLFIFWANANSQITALENAEQTDLSLTASNTGTANRSSLAYNPVKGVFYSVNAGSGNYYVDSYNAAGELLDSVISGFDYRGAWWNPLLFTFEGNSYNSIGIISRILDPFTGAATDGGSIVAANTQPNSQSVGDLDTANYELIYYDLGSIFRYSRLDDQLLGSAVLTGLPDTAVLNGNSVYSTGIEDMEYGVYDYANQSFIFINRLGEFVSQSQLPATAATPASYMTSWAKRLFWLFDSGTKTWSSYRVLQGAPVGINDRDLNVSGSIKIFPNPVDSETQLDFGNLNAELSHIRLLSASGAVIKEYTDISSTKITLNLQDESRGIYILQLTTLEGETYSKKLIKQ